MSSSGTKRKSIDHNVFYDVYFGRGNRIANIVGTRNYREKVKELKSSYKQLKKTKQKQQMAMEIVDAFERNGGKFYYWENDTERWVVAPKKKKLLTIKQALREKHGTETEQPEGIAETIHEHFSGFDCPSLSLEDHKTPAHKKKKEKKEYDLQNDTTSEGNHQKSVDLQQNYANFDSEDGIEPAQAPYVRKGLGEKSIECMLKDTSIGTFVVPDDSESNYEDLKPSKAVLLKDLNRNSRLSHSYLENLHNNATPSTHRNDIEQVIDKDPPQSQKMNGYDSNYKDTVLQAKHVHLSSIKKKVKSMKLVYAKSNDYIQENKKQGSSSNINDIIDGNNDESTSFGEGSPPAQGSNNVPNISKDACLDTSEHNLVVFLKDLCKQSSKSKSTDLLHFSDLSIKW